MIKIPRSVRRAGVLVAFAILATAPALATDSEKDALTEQKEIEKLKQEIAEARKATAEAQVAEAKAKLGTLSATPPTGEATDLKAEGKLVAYAAVDDVARIIAADVKRSAKASPVVLYSTKELNAIIQARAVLRNVQELDRAIKSFRLPKLAAEVSDCKEPDDVGVTISPLDALSILQSLLKVSKSTTGSEITLDDFALASAVIRQLRLAGVNNVVYPSQFFAGAFADPQQDPLANSEIAKSLATLNTDLALIDLRLAEITKRKEAVQQRVVDKSQAVTPVCQAAVAEAKVLFENTEARGNALKARANAIVAAVAVVDEASGATILQVLAQMEALSKGNAGAHVLQLRPVAAGGTTLTKTGLFSTNFYASGSAVVAYMLTNDQGKVITSGVVGQYGGNVKLDDLRQTVQAHRTAINFEQKVE
ncbi:hypothetical protein [Aquabacterium sp.]|uniref:hypothetical protein n=1 Tax=Aquabacterium sp. TaxID=1872578 RepID=UPI0025B8A314|nr:hypothetical protein [Aquabacterium sp.]